jgi:hypothetical protein
MKRIKLWIKAFIIRTVVDDYQMNGKIRTMVKSEDRGQDQPRHIRESYKVDTRLSDLIRQAES